jgi:hypothetical protein
MDPLQWVPSRPWWWQKEVNLMQCSCLEFDIASRQGKCTAWAFTKCNAVVLQAVISIYFHPYSDTIPHPPDSDPETSAPILSTLVSSEMLLPPRNSSIPFWVCLWSLFLDTFPDHALPIWYFNPTLNSSELRELR